MTVYRAPRNTKVETLDFTVSIEWGIGDRRIVPVALSVWTVTGRPLTPYHLEHIGDILEREATLVVPEAVSDEDYAETVRVLAPLRERHAELFGGDAS